MGRFRSYRFHLICALLIVSLAGCETTGPDPISQAPYFPPNDNFDAILPTMNVLMPPERRDLYHEVAPMETLWRISKMYGVDQQTIINANGIKDATKIKTGQKLLIPYAEEPRSIIPLYNTRSWQYIVIHHTATDQGNALNINASHYKRGFDRGLGYHFLIDNGTMGKKVGQVEIGPRWVKQMDGAHCKADNMNERGIGIAVVGNYSETNISDQQLNSLVTLVNILRAHYGIPKSRILGHGRVHGAQTECPGTHFPWNEFMRRLDNPTQS